MILREGGNYNDMISPGAPNPPEPLHELGTPENSTSVPWIETHPYLATTVGVGGLLMLGTVLVIGRGDVAPTRESGAWGGAGGFFAGTIRNLNPDRLSTEEAMRQQSHNSYATIPIYTPPLNTGTETEAEDNLADLLAQLVVKDTPKDVPGELTTPEGYAFIPQGYVSTETPETKRSPEQELLFTYGNQLGTFVKGYESLHSNSPQILKDHVEDRGNPDKIRALTILGTDMQQFGIELRNLPNIPTLASGIHKEYANAYIRAGRDLISVAKTSTDTEFLTAIAAYNSGVERLTTQFIAVVELFGAYEVRFSDSDDGSIFMFNPNLSLLQ